ncbi:MAG TPA: LytTR family DNA-binding domain-containing protein [Bacteroidia bacterium]|nr:LytTR family DNA-binding domain-containing protein [Bacteroidia bacterium]
MSSFSAIIIDDEEHGRNNLAYMLQQYCPQITVSAIASGVGTALPLIAQHRPDLVFLDILMPDTDGFGLLDHFRNKLFDVIFVSASSEYGIQALKAGAVEYLLKPVSPKELVLAVNKFEQLRKNYLREPDAPSYSRISLAHATGFHLESLNNIVRLEADDNYTRLFFANGKSSLISKSLAEFERVLPDNLFARIHKSIIINLEYLEEFSHSDGGTVKMADGHTTLVSKRKKNELLEKVGNIAITLKS